MKKTILLTTVLLLAAGTAFAQHGHGNCGNCPHHQQHQQHGRHQQAQAGVSFDQALAKAFPAMLSTKKEGRWTAVYDAQKKLLGYAVASKPASDGIKGYAGETPVMIAFNAKKRIAGVYLLANQETPGFVQRVEQTGYFNSWNGLTVKKAIKKEVDAVSGATLSSGAIARSVQAALKAL